MAAASTLNSRLRVLVAKTFRAEKLYNSIPNAQSERLTNVSALAQSANDIRAKEWQRTHYQLRVALNEVLNEGNSSTLVENIVALRERFHARAEESADAVELGVESITDTAARHEFAHIFRLSVDMIRHKARAQASRIVTEELTAVLESSGRSLNPEEALKRLEQHEVDRQAAKEVETPMPSNVIPLRRRFAAGGRGR